MIGLHHPRGGLFWLNPRLIERIETSPDTTLILTDGRTLLVADPPDAVIDAIVRFERRIAHPTGRDTATDQEP